MDLFYCSVPLSIARSAKLSTGLYILRSVVSFLFQFERTYLRIYWTDLHDFFTKWKVFVWMLSIRSSFFPIPQGTLPWQPILCQNCGKITYPPALVALSFRKGMRYRYLNVRNNSANDRVKISWNSVQKHQSWQSLLWTSGTTKAKKCCIDIVEYLRIYWSDFRNLLTIWKCYTRTWWICTSFSNLLWDVAMATK